MRTSGRQEWVKVLIIIIPPTPPAATHTATFWEGGRLKKYSGGHRVRRGENSRAGEGRWGGPGNEARKPQAPAAMTYCELGQVTAAYKRISSSEHGQRRISASQMTDSTYREQCCIHWRWKGPEGEAPGSLPVSRISGPPRAHRVLEGQLSAGASPMTSEAAPGLK